MCSVCGLIDHGGTAWESSSKKMATSIAWLKMSLTSSILYKCLRITSNFIYPLWLPKHARFMDQQSSYLINYFRTSHEGIVYDISQNNLKYRYYKKHQIYYSGVCAHFIGLSHLKTMSQLLQISLKIYFTETMSSLGEAILCPEYPVSGSLCRDTGKIYSRRTKNICFCIRKTL